MALSLHEEFSSLNVFKKALKMWATQDNFDYRIMNSNTERVAACCRSQGDICPFSIWCYFNQRREIAIITTLYLTHNCLSAPLSQAPGSDLSWLVKEIPKLMAITKETSSSAIIDCVQINSQQSIRVQQAQCVHRFLLQKHFASHAESFQKVLD
jgi:hypothetical protein